MDKELEKPKTVRVNVKPGSGPFLLSIAGAEPRRYAENEGSVDVPEAELEDFLTHVSGSSVSLPEAPAAKGE